jgi:formylglycine-generating enzyme required for sulfatase activity
MASLMETLDPDRRRALENIREAVARIWARPLHHYFTDHAVTHSERIITLLDGLTACMMETDKRLSSAESFILLAAAYLHDIGMQDGRFAGGDLERIRDLHNEQTAEMIYKAFEDPTNAIPIPLVRDPGFVEAVARVSKGHRNVELGADEYKPFVQGSEKVRPRLLAALLCFGDELDIDYRRVDLDVMGKLLALPVESQLHWWRCHYVGGVSIVDENIQIGYRFPQDRPDYEGLVVPLVENEIRSKLAALKEIFRANAVKVDWGPREVSLMRAVRHLPPEVEKLVRQKLGTTNEPAPQPPNQLPSEYFLGTMSEREADYSQAHLIPDTVLVPAGPFWMGSSDSDPHAKDSEKPRHESHLLEYHIGRFPVTNVEYKSFLEANPQYRIPFSNEMDDRLYNWDNESRSFPPDKGDHPVVLVSWNDAIAYCSWLSQVTGKQYRLPIEEEWEKAARGSFPSEQRYPWEGDWKPDCSNTCELGLKDTTSIHHFEEKNKSPFGIVDMAGNVWEWTNSWFKPYPGSLHESKKFGETHRVVRGGSWFHESKLARISCRGRYELTTMRRYLGFRVVLATSPVDLAKLHQDLIAHFDLEELKMLCFQLHIDFDDLRGEGKEGKARELITYVERRSRTLELREMCRRLRPAVLW